MDHADSVHYDISRPTPYRSTLAETFYLYYFRAETLFCHVSLWSADGREHHSAVLNPRATMSRSEEMEIRSCLGPLANHRTLEAASADATISATARKATADQYCDLLVGTHLARSRVLFDLDDSQGMFFIFGDLGVRSPGKYILKCSVLSFNM
nr:hypothetical protein HK105_005562 [Polyrhizophydium stewartii]